MSRIEQHIVSAWADKLTTTIIKEVKNELEGMEATLSGDSGLQSVWEEVCAQVQHEESSEWLEYRYLIDELLHACVECLDRDAQLALWAVTEQGWNYIYDHHADADGVTNAPLDTDDIVTELADKILSAAADYESKSLYLYIWGEENPEDDEEEAACNESEYLF